MNLLHLLENIETRTQLKTQRILTIHAVCTLIHHKAKVDKPICTGAMKGQVLFLLQECILRGLCYPFFINF